MNTQNLIDQITELVLAEITKMKSAEKLIPVGISARHVHLTQQEVEILKQQNKISEEKIS